MNVAQLQALTDEIAGAGFARVSLAQTDQLIIEIGVDKLEALMKGLASHPKLYFDHLSCITAIDINSGFELVYNLYSYPFNLQVAVKVLLEKEQPSAPTMSHIWRTANWHEREAFDLFGIHFTNHPDLRRILLPADWLGHPLRKDYQQQDYYHGMKVAWEKPPEPDKSSV